LSKSPAVPGFFISGLLSFQAFLLSKPFTSMPLFVWRHIALQMALLCRWRDAEFRAVRIFTDAILPCGRMMPMTACGDMAVGC
jgi:hypothetical protein